MGGRRIHGIDLYAGKYGRCTCTWVKQMQISEKDYTFINQGLEENKFVIHVVQDKAKKWKTQNCSIPATF